MCLLMTGRSKVWLFVEKLISNEVFNSNEFIQNTQYHTIFTWKDNYFFVKEYLM